MSILLTDNQRSRWKWKQHKL